MKKFCVILFLLLFLLGNISNSEAATKKKKDKTKAIKVSNNVADLEKEVRQLREKLSVMEMHCPSNAKPLKLTVTAAVIGKKLSISALGIKVKPGQVAISQDQADKLHKWLYIPGLGKVFVACIMPQKWSNRVDYYTTDLKKAKKIGVSVKPVAVLRG